MKKSKLSIYAKGASAFLVSSLIMVSCNSRMNLDDVIEAPNPEETEARVSFAGHFFETGTRAAMTEDDLLNSDKLLTAKDLLIVFYTLDDQGDPASVSSRYTREFEIYRGQTTGKDLESFSFEDNILHIKGEETLPMDDYAVVYFTSPSNEIMTATEVGKNFSELSKALSITDKMEENGSIRYSIYSNVSDPLMVTEQEMRQNGPSKVFQIAPSNLIALNGLIFVTADPVMKDENYFIPKDRTVYLRLNVANKSLVPLAVNETVTLTDATEALIPKDDNYDTSALSEVGLEDKFYYHGKERFFEHNANYITFSGTSVEKPNANWVMPVPENTVSHLSLNSNTVTQLLILVPVYPTSLLGEITEAQKETTLLSWLRVGGKDYLMTTFKSLYLEASKVADAKRTEEQRLIITAGRELAKMNPDYLETEDGTEPTAYFPNYSCHSANVDFFHEGKCYYSIPIRHLSDDKQPDPTKDGRYGVVRNTLYYYHISSFSTLGVASFEQLNDRVRVYDEEVDASLGSPIFAKPDFIGRTVEL